MYTDQVRVEAYLQRGLTENEVTIVDEVIESVSKFIETYCNRQWSPVDDESTEEPEAEPRFFDGNGQREIIIDDFSDIEEIAVLDSNGDELHTFTTSDDWILLPRNSTSKSRIMLRHNHFIRGYSNIQVTAVWGAGTPPAGVVQTCTVLVGNYLNRGGNKNFKKESIEGYSYELATNGNPDEEVIKNLDIYKKFIL